MELLLLIWMVVKLNRWMHRKDQMLYTREELDAMRREPSFIGFDSGKV